jgi:hypothetical protein
MQTMSNAITLKIGGRDPIAFWCDLEKHLTDLYRLSEETGVISSEQNLDMMIFILDFALILSQQHPGRAKPDMNVIRGILEKQKMMLG